MLICTTTIWVTTAVGLAAPKGVIPYLRQHFLDRTFQGLYQANAFDYALLIPYFIVLILLASYGLHRYILVYLYYKNRKNRTTEPVGRFEDLPRVTVQLPMFYGLATNKVRVPGLRFTHTLCDIETLNQKAKEGVYDVTAISFHAFPYIQDKYALLPSGGSVGEGYGPMIVATRAFSQSEVKRKRIAIPGKLTTAYLALQLFSPGIDTEVVPFDQIIPEVLEGKHAGRPDGGKHRSGRH